MSWYLWFEYYKILQLHASSSPEDERKARPNKSGTKFCKYIHTMTGKIGRYRGIRGPRTVRHVQKEPKGPSTSYREDKAPSRVKHYLARRAWGERMGTVTQAGAKFRLYYFRDLNGVILIHSYLPTRA